MSNMIKKKCGGCGKDVWHNESGKALGTYRCTYCGNPPHGVGDKVALQRAIMDKQVAKAVRS